MLLKIEAIQEIGRFASLKHKAPQFEKFVLIYARNGYGKSTLCSVIRSAADQDVKLLAARRRLGAKQESVVQTLWQSAGSIVFASGKWSNTPGEIHIFDAEYIRRNVHTADSVTRENKRNLIPVVLGAYGVKLSKMISALDIEQRDIANAQSAIEKNLKAALPVVTDVGPFAAAKVPEDIELQISAAERGLELAKQTAAIHSKHDPRSISLPSVSSCETVLSKGIDAISEQAVDLVNRHITDHSLTPHGERWIKYGVEHMDGDKCPFCTQDTSKIDLVAVFKGYFGAGYSALTTEIETYLSTASNAYGNNGEKIIDLLNQNAADFLFWTAVSDIESAPSIDEDNRAKLIAGISDLKTLLEQKATHPLSQISLGEKKSNIDLAINMLCQYNDDVTRCVEAISKTRAEAQTSDLAAATTLLNKRRALKAKLEDHIKNDLASWEINNRRKLEIENEKKQAQSMLRTHMNSVVVDRQSTINELLEVFGANFRIINTKASFVGREANTEFSIAIGDHSVKAGEHSLEEPSFTTILSAGDKFTLALSFFIAQVRSDPDLDKARIIFDDPFSSQDMQRQWETTSQIRSLAGDARQVIVLSHDPRFLALIEKNSSSCKTYQLTCDDEGNGAISSWSAEDELKDIYVRQAQRIREYAKHGRFLKGSTPETLVKDLRPFLEDYVRARYPGRFAPLVMLDEMTTEIERSGISDSLYGSISDLRAINEYSRDNMHGGASIPDADQLRGQCRRVCAIMG
ncbi:MAG: AAA family ATPase [Hyphomicrobiales bacterium]|nr:AAA family ATPase [Hyphomicrobiales bacterium]